MHSSVWMLLSVVKVFHTVIQHTSRNVQTPQRGNSKGPKVFLIYSYLISMAIGTQHSVLQSQHISPFLQLTIQLANINTKMIIIYMIQQLQCMLQLATLMFTFISVYITVLHSIFDITKCWLVSVAHDGNEHESRLYLYHGRVDAI